MIYHFNHPLLVPVFLSPEQDPSPWSTSPPSVIYLFVSVTILPVPILAQHSTTRTPSHLVTLLLLPSSLILDALLSSLMLSRPSVLLSLMSSCSHLLLIALLLRPLSTAYFYLSEGELQRRKCHFSPLLQ